MSRRARDWPPGTPCWTDLATSDPEAARAFYGAVLGWEYEIGGPEHGGYALAGVAGGATAAGIGPLMVPGTPTAWTVHLATDDAGATARAAVEAGGTVVFGPMEIPDRGTQLLLADPAGALTGAWEAGPFIGAGVVNEPGALSWEDLRTADPDASRAFLTAVFGMAHDTFEGAPDDYTTLRLDEPYPLGGLGPLWGAPASQWVVYFGVADLDAAVAVATEHGGTVLSGVDDTPFGRMAQLADPQGALFTLMQNTGQPQPDRA